MSVSAIGLVNVSQSGPQNAAPPAPAADGGSENLTVQAPAQAAPAPGTGIHVDKTV